MVRQAYTVAGMTNMAMAGDLGPLSRYLPNKDVSDELRPPADDAPDEL